MPDRNRHISRPYSTARLDQTPPAPPAGLRRHAGLPGAEPWPRLYSNDGRDGRVQPLEASGKVATMLRWEVKVLYDGQCPVCRREADLLRWLDGGRRRLLLEDISDPQFDPARYGLTMDQVMGQIHGVLRNGRLVKGMEVFRQAYDAVGLGWLLAPTNWPVLRPLSDTAYAWFARNRLRLTGRLGECPTGRCRVPPGGT
jgi:predicted DCC family thiol-disulfide oxidoreductase YuxK